MNKKKIIMLIVIFILLGLGIGLIIWNGVRTSKENDKIMSEIRDNYKELEDNINSYNNVRSNLVKIVNRYYSSEMDEYYDKFINSLNEEKKLLEDIYKDVEVLDDLCLDRLFKDSEVNNMCRNYKVYYETLNNIYVNDIGKVNDIIVGYNDEYSSNLEVYSNKIDYVDYNKDGVFLEREDM